MKILVVDDGIFNLQIVKKMIEESSIEVQTILCQHPDEVMGYLEKEQIDIILLDIIMPKISGLDLLKEIRKEKKYDNVPILMLTAVTDQETFKACFENGANDYINKPIDIVQFVARVKAALNTRKSSLLLEEMFAKTKLQNKELKELNQKLQETQFHIIQKEKLASIGELAAGVAHEINNPMGFISSNLETLGNFMTKVKHLLEVYSRFVDSLETDFGNFPKFLEGKEYIRDLEKKQKIDFILGEFDGLLHDSLDGVERVTKIVQSLRNFARTGLADEMNYYDLNQVIEETLLIAQNEAKYVLDIEKSLSELPLVLFDKGQIGQVLLNLLINAIQAVKSQERTSRGKIIIETYFDEQYIGCSITDDGPGIKKENLSKIFNPFFTTKEVGKGTGLGLSISYDIIVKKHQGEFTVDSELGKGSVFTFKLPIAREKGEDSE